MKKYFFALLLLFSCKSEPGVVKGVITYYFNDNYGDKPDVGAKVYFIPKEQLTEDFVKPYFEFKSAQVFIEGAEECELSASLDSHQVNFYNDMQRRYGGDYSDIAKDRQQSFELSVDRHKEMWNKLNEKNIKTKEDFYVLDKSAAEVIDSLIFGKQFNSFNYTADGSGGFQATLQPGSYFVIIQSNHRKNQSCKTEFNHMSNCTWLEVESSKEKTLAHNFTIK